MIPCRLVEVNPVESWGQHFGPLAQAGVNPMPQQPPMNPDADHGGSGTVHLGWWQETG